VARNLLKVDVTWAKIASLYCVAGGLAVDCVRQVGQHLNFNSFSKDDCRQKSLQSSLAFHMVIRLMAFWPKLGKEFCQVAKGSLNIEKSSHSLTVKNLEKTIEVCNCSDLDHVLKIDVSFNFFHLFKIID